MKTQIVFRITAMICGLLAWTVTHARSAELFKNPQYNVAHEFEIIYGKGAVAGGEMDLALDLYRPDGPDVPKLKPGFVAIHGGAFLGGDKRLPKSNMADLAEEMARRGYVAISINYRLIKDKPRESGEEMVRARSLAEKSFAARAQSGEPVAPERAHITQEDLATARAAALIDSAKAITWLVENAARYGIDPKRIAIGGASAGSGTALNLVYVSNNPAGRKPRVVVDMWGDTDPEGLSNIAANEPPVIIIHGKNDRSVPIAEAEALAARAKELGLPYAYFPVEGAGHGVPLGREIEGKTLYQHIADFLYQHLDLAALK